MRIIYELDSYGLNLQETRLNLIEQGYEDVWEEFLRFTINRGMQLAVLEIVNDSLKALMSKF